MDLREFIENYSEINDNEWDRVEYYLKERYLKNEMLLYIHGGGFISGSCLAHRMHIARFASGSKLKSLVFNYRLAPVDPFPIGLEDCIEVYSWLLRQGYKCQNYYL